MLDVEHGGELRFPTADDLLMNALLIAQSAWLVKDFALEMCRQILLLHPVVSVGVRIEIASAVPEAFGIPAVKASNPDEVDGAIRFAQEVDGPALVWFEIAEEQNVFPMMPAGKGLPDLIETWGGPTE